MTRTAASGFTLLPVVLAMSLLAVIAFLLNRDNGLNARMVASQADLDRARYAAEAGLQAANFAVQAAGCTGTYPISSAPVTNSNFGGAAYSAYSTTASGISLTLVSTGTYNGASVVLTRNNVLVYKARRTTVLQPGPGAGQDTYVANGTTNNFGSASSMSLDTGSAQPLVSFGLTSFMAGTRAVPWYDSANAKLQSGAVMSLYQTHSTGASTGTPTLNLYRITQNWTANGATWFKSDGINNWPAPGVGYAPTPFASVPYPAGTTWIDWDVTNAVNLWLSGVYSNYGFWLVEANGTVHNNLYVASDDTTNLTLRPKLTLSVLEPCNAPTTVTLTVMADTYVRSDQDSANFGGAASLYAAAASPGPEQRVLLRFDTSAIPVGSTITSALLRLRASAVQNQSSQSKIIQAFRVIESWLEGTDTGGKGADGATWKSRDATKSGAWTTPGGTYDSSWSVKGTEEASGLSPLPAGFTQGWVTWDVTALVQAHVGGVSPNYGVLLISAANSDVLQFSARESGANTAQLVVTYR